MSTLYIVGTPLGNLEDISLRALRVLGEVDVLACEDTRTTRKIFERHNLPSPRIRFSCHEHNEEQAAKRIIGLLQEGCSVGLVTDGGMPGISDPGYDVINLCREKGYRVEVIPGPSAAITALIASGLPTASFTFKGFPPRKAGKRRQFLESDKDLPHTLIFFESPYRVLTLLTDALEVLGNRQAAVCRELTKQYEHVDRGYLTDILAGLKESPPLRGEITVVIAGNHPKFYRPDEKGSS